MTSAEELFAKFFSGEKMLVQSMDDLQLRAHREELQKIAFEARARLTAVDDEGRERGAKRKKGFQTSVEVDEASSDLINTVKERQKKLTKIERLVEKLMEMPGITREDAERMVSAGHQLELRERKKEVVSASPAVQKPFSANPFSSTATAQEETVTSPLEKEPKEEKPSFTNPFAKKD